MIPKHCTVHTHPFIAPAATVRQISRLHWQYTVHAARNSMGLTYTIETYTSLWRCWLACLGNNSPSLLWGSNCRGWNCSPVWSGYPGVTLPLSSWLCLFDNPSFLGQYLCYQSLFYPMAEVYIAYPCSRPCCMNLPYFTIQEPVITTFLKAYSKDYNLPHKLQEKMSIEP